MRKAMGEEGRRRVVRQFDWKEAARKTIEVYREVL